MNKAQSLLHDLVKIQSVTGHEAETKQALNLVEERLKNCGMHIYRTNFKGFEALVATSRETKTPKVMLAGHIDVVPASADMFKLQISEGKIVGRGAWDMKSAIAGYILAAEKLAKDLTSYDFGIMLSSDEERHDLGIKQLIEEGYYPTETAILFDGAENWQLEKAAKGAVAFKISILDKTGHGSRPWLVDSSSMRLVKLLSELQQLFLDASPTANTLNISAIGAGEVGKALNQIPAQATATIDIRTISLAEHDRLLAEIDKICKKYGAGYEKLVEFAVIEHDQNAAHYKAFAASVEKVTGVKNKGLISSGVSSAGHFAKKGVDCIVTWPIGGGHHSEDEWIDAKALDDIEHVLVDYLQKMAKV